MLTGGTQEHLSELWQQARSRILTPGRPGWDVARRAWQAAVDQRPAAIALPACPNEVAAVFAFAGATGLRVAPQGTGHNAAPLGGLGHSVLLRTANLSGVWIDPERRRARVGAGAVWGDVVAAATEHGLAALSGSSPDVGVAGYSLGGGIGWLARRHGMQANQLRAVELVTPDGEHVRADDDNEADLFWALRGGGGNFGVVTALEFDLLPVEHVYGGALVWDWRYAGPVLLRWSEWAQTAPDRVTTSARILQLPQRPEVPEPLRGRRIVMIDGAYLGDEAEAGPVLEPLRRLRPQLDTFAPMPPAGLVRLHGDPETATPIVSEHRLLGELPRAAVEALVTTAGPGSRSPLVNVELRQLGGALAHRPERHGALARIDGAFALFAAGRPEDEDHAAAIRAHAQAVAAAVGPWSNGRRYLNFAERPTDSRAAYTVADHRRLQAVRMQVDPYGVMHANHPIRP